MKVLILTAEQFEDCEVLVPYYRLKEENVAVDIVAPARGTIRGKHGYTVEATRATKDVGPDDYDLLIVPGGHAPETLCDDSAARRIAVWFFEQDKPVAAICHGPLLLARADLVAGRHVTCHPSIAYELRSAGAHFEDREVITDDSLVTSRGPADLPAFMRAVMKRVPRVHEPRG
jgi:protease I